MSLKNQNLQSIQKQIELYFSDANLRHDKYMLNILQTSEQGNIPISKILSFNKIISLKANSNDIIEALKNSKSLQVNVESQTICRKVPFNFNVDSQIPYNKILFIKRVPINWYHKTIREIFECFGNVAIVRLPKINKSHTRRNYGFVEMETVDEAKIVLDSFKKRFPHSRLKILPWSKWILKKESYKAKRKRKTRV